MDVAKRLLVISIVILVIVSWIYFANFFWEEWRTLDKEFRDFIPSASLAGIGFFLYTIRNVEGVNRHLVSALGVLIMVIVPLVAGLRLMMDSSIGQSIFAGGIATFSVIWFLYFVMKESEDKKEQKEIKKARPLMIMMFFILLSYSILAFVMIQSFQNFLKNVPQI